MENYHDFSGFDKNADYWLVIENERLNGEGNKKKIFHNLAMLFQYPGYVPTEDQITMFENCSQHIFWELRKRWMTSQEIEKNGVYEERSAARSNRLLIEEEVRILSNDLISLLDYKLIPSSHVQFRPRYLLLKANCHSYLAEYQEYASLQGYATARHLSQSLNAYSRTKAKVAMAFATYLFMKGQRTRTLEIAKEALECLKLSEPDKVPRWAQRIKTWKAAPPTLTEKVISAEASVVEAKAKLKASKQELKQIMEINKAREAHLILETFVPPQD